MICLVVYKHLYDYGTIVWKRNPYHTKLIIWMTHWKIGHLCRCVTISHKHRDAATRFLSTVCMKARVSLNITKGVGRKPRFWQTITSAARLNPDANEWNESKFLPNERMFSCNIKFFPTWDLTTLLKVEVVKYSELSTLLFPNFIAIFGVFVGAQHSIKFGRW